MLREIGELKKLIKATGDSNERLSFFSKMFMGNIDIEEAFSLEMFVINDEKFLSFYKNLEKFLKEKVDPELIDREEKVPDEVFKELKDMGMLGMKIPVEFGGLGFTMSQYCQVMKLIGSYSMAVYIWVTANCSIGLSGPLAFVGTEEQKKEFLPKLAGGADSGFGLTQVTVGSFPQDMIGTDTLAIPTENGFRIVGHKLYNTNGPLAKYEVIMAPLSTTNKICAFIVPTSGFGFYKATKLSFRGNRGIENALIQFDVEIPKNFLLGNLGDGLKIAFKTLNIGRIAIAAACAGITSNCLQLARWRAKTRGQNKKPIGEFELQANRVAKMACEALAIEAITSFSLAMHEKYGEEVDLRSEAAACKWYGAEHANAAVSNAQKIFGGKGYETYDSQKKRSILVKPHEVPLPVDRIWVDAKLLEIGEGTDDIQEILLSLAGISRQSAKLLTICRTIVEESGEEKEKIIIPKIPGVLGWYFLWYFFGSHQDPIMKGEIPEVLRKHLGFAITTNKKLSRKLFRKILKYKARLKNQQIILKYIIDSFIEVFTIIAVCWFANKKYKKYGDILLEVADVHCQYARYRIKGESENNPHPKTDAQAYELAQRIIFEDAADFLEQGIVSILDLELEKNKTSQ